MKVNQFHGQGLNFHENHQNMILTLQFHEDQEHSIRILDRCVLLQLVT